MILDTNEDISCGEIVFVSELSFMSGEELNLSIAQTIHMLRGWIEFRMLPLFRPSDLRGLIEYLEAYMREEEHSYELDYAKMSCEENFIMAELLIDLTNINIKAYNYLNIEEMKDLVNWLKKS